MTDNFTSAPTFLKDDPNKIARGLWGCVEMDAASRGFSYSDYLWFHKKVGCKSVPLLEISYMLVCDILDYEVEVAQSKPPCDNEELQELRNDVLTLKAKAKNELRT